MHVRFGHEILAPLVEEYPGMCRSEQILKNQFKVRLRLRESSETPEVALEHEPVSDTDSTNQQRLAGGIHNLGSSRMHKLRMAQRHREEEQCRNYKTSKQQSIPPLG